MSREANQWCNSGFDFLFGNRLFNLLHAEVSYIIDIACHWTFFSNITSFSYFLGCQNPNFFSIFQLPIFAEMYRPNLCSPMSTLITGPKYAISPHISALFGCCFTISSNFLWKICTKSRNLGWKQENLNKIGNVLVPGTEKQMLVMCACGLRSCVMTSWIFHEL